VAGPFLSAVTRGAVPVVVGEIVVGVIVGRAGLAASRAELGVPAAVPALGLADGVLTSARAGAIVAASILGLAVCSAGASLLGGDPSVKHLAPPGTTAANHSAT
jgi:hypothetical protein